MGSTRLLTEDARKNSVYFLEVIIEIEMITRCCRHYVSSLLRSSDIIQCAPGPFIAKFLNVLLGCGTVDTADEASDPGKQANKKGDKRAGLKKKKD